MTATPLPELALPLVVLSGAGLSAASGVPTFRGAGGLWEGQRVEDVATPGAWSRDPDRVRRFYAARRDGVARVRPNPGHAALVRLQRALGREAVMLVTQNVDGLLQRAAEEVPGPPVEVLEMHGTLWAVRCERSERHPRRAVEPGGDHRAAWMCAACGAALRPDIVWFGEMPRHMDRIAAALARCRTFLSVGTSGLVYPAAGFVALARQAGARCVEVNPEPTRGPFHVALAEGAEVALPRLVDAWLADR